MARRTQVPRRRSGSQWLWIGLIAALAFWLGRLTVETGRPPASNEERTERTEVQPSCPEPLPCPEARTSTLAMCPCPKPKLAKTLPIKRKPRPLLPTGPGADRDPTAKTAQYLREHAKDLHECAPKAGAELRIHVEVTVRPEGAIDRIELTNLDPPPAAIADCVKQKLESLKPPGFDASSPETFALTVVL